MLKGGAKIWHKTKYPLSLASSNNTMHAKVTEGEKKQCNKETDVILKQLQKRRGRPYSRESGGTGERYAEMMDFRPWLFLVPVTGTS